MRTMAKLQIQLLGNFHMAEGETAVSPLTTARLQTFFCFLLIHAKQPLPRHYIAALLWPDSTESQARTNLRKAIHQLRNQFPTTDRLFHINSKVIQWRADAPAMVDIHQFAHCVAQANTLKNNQQTRIIEMLEKAVDLYQGNLLPACYEEWISAPREHFATQYLQALDQLVQLLTEKNNYDQAIVYCLKLLAHDSLHEASYRRLIRLYGLAGNRAKALEAYQQCVTVLHEEMDIAPSAATQAVYAQVKAVPLQMVAQAANEPHPTHLEQMSILCIDIADFSTISVTHDAQAVLTGLNQYMNLLAQCIEAGNGQVIKRMGDALLGMFVQAGDALLTAYAIQDELQPFNEVQKENGRLPFHTRIGIATGNVLLSHLEINGVREIEVMGTCINLAVRLQHITPIDGLALDQRTYMQCKSLVQGHVSETLLTNKNDHEPVYIVGDGKIERK